MFSNVEWTVFMTFSLLFAQVKFQKIVKNIRQKGPSLQMSKTQKYPEKKNCKSAHVFGVFD